MRVVLARLAAFDQHHLRIVEQLFAGQHRRLRMAVLHLRLVEAQLAGQHQGRARVARGVLGRQVEAVGAGVDGVVQRLGNLVCPPPVDAHVAAEDQHDDPIDHAMVDAEDEHLDQLDDDHQQQRDRQCAGDAGEKARKQRAEQHHADVRDQRILA